MNTNKITNTNSEKKTTGKDKKIIHQLTAWSTCGIFIIVISIIFDVLYSGGVIHTNRLSLIFRIIGLVIILITTIIHMVISRNNHKDVSSSKTDEE